MRYGILALSLLTVLLFGCAGTFEEARIAGAQKRASYPPGSAQAAASSPERCQSLSNAARTEGALGKFGAVLTGATGISTWPLEGDLQTGAAITSGVLAAGTATALWLYETDSAAYIAEGCGAAK